MVDILSQAEIDALLAALDGGAPAAAPVADPRPALATHRNQVVKNYDFRRPDKFSKDQIRALHMIMENFSRSWGTFLSGKLHSLVYLELNSIDQMTYEEFLQSLSSPTVIAVFSLAPLEGSALLEINANLAFTMIDRLLGGTGRSMGITRELTEIEAAIMGGIVSDTWSYLRTALKDIVPVNPRLEGLECNPQFVQIVPPGDMVLFISISMRIGDVRDILVFCFPFLLLEPILSKLNTQQFFAVRRETE
ncbi:MAG TPA: flagellar motor switch protein FliM, partial [bacterium]|nr:flagellar motor switch protein FliM [bacterium]